MIHGPYLIAIAIATLFSWASWVVVINELSPFTQPAWALSLFFASLFFALTGTFTLIIYSLKVWGNKREIYNKHLNTSIRQGVLLSAMICVGLFFERLKVLTWWDGLLLLAIVLLIEFYFMSRE
jgi:hypothetical protein